MEFTWKLIAFHCGLLALLIAYLYSGEIEWFGCAIALCSFVVFDFLYLLHTVISELRAHPLVDGAANQMMTSGHMDLHGTNVLITGASSGIGLAVAKLLSEKAANLLLVARNPDRLQSAVDELTKLNHGNRIASASIDITAGYHEVVRCVREAEVSFGDTDVLINCAGYSLPAEFCTAPPDDFMKMMSTNYLGAVQMTRCVVEGMKKKRRGQLVFLSSMAGQVACFGYSSYAASKFALKGLAETLTAELTHWNVGVTVVFPPDTDTPGLAKENEDKPEVTKIIGEGIGMWTAEQVAEKIVTGLELRSRAVTFGGDGFFAHALTCGGYLPDSLMECLTQAFLAPILRIYIVFLQNSFANIARRHAK